MDPEADVDVRSYRSVSRGEERILFFVLMFIDKFTGQATVDQATPLMPMLHSNRLGLDKDRSLDNVTICRVSTRAGKRG